MPIVPDSINARAEVAMPIAKRTGLCPPAFLEYAWYVSLVYAYLGAVWGIVIPAVGGAILALLAVACLVNIGDRAISLCRPVAWGFYTGISVLLVEGIFHDLTEGAMPEVIAFVGWLTLLIIVQTLALRPNFLHHFALVALAIGIASLPYVNVRSVGGVTRAWASGTGISNPNVLGMWFGFCTVYFIFWGLQCRTPLLRAASWVVAVGSFYVVTLTVSRAPLLGIALACIVGFRSALRRSFIPVVSFLLVLCLVYVSGVFDEELGQYVSRGAEESGRGKLWPAAVERILNSPWAGYGLDNIKLLTRSGKVMNPHNGLLHIALGVGLIPLLCFVGYLARVMMETGRIMWRGQVGEAALLPPLVVFGLFETMALDFTFMSPWAVVVFGIAASTMQAGGSKADYSRLQAR